MIIELLNFNRVCKHDKVRIDADFSYCPDCGELIENQWYIARCATCGIKLKAFVNKHGEIVAQDKFCHNCGSKGYIIERLNTLQNIRRVRHRLRRINNQNPASLMNGFTELFDI